jgi:hypothetical protein
MAEVPSFNTNVGSAPPNEGVSGSKAALVLLLITILAGLGLYFGPRHSKTVAKTMEKVRELVHSIQAAITNTPPKPEETATETPDPSKKHRPRPSNGTSKSGQGGELSTITGSGDLPFAFPAAPDVVPFESQANAVRHGTERAKVLELYGDPDLKISFLDHGSLIEQFTWVNKSLGTVTNISLKAGRVVDIRKTSPRSVVLSGPGHSAQPVADFAQGRRPHAGS